VERKFRTQKDADNRAIGGLSMGGNQTVSIGFANPDKFHSIVVMSAGAQNVEQNYPGFFKDTAATNKKLKLLWVGIGKDDKLVMANNNALKDALAKAGVKHTYRETDGRHEWVVWRHHLREVAPLLFR
jgi:enterochelin esterase family protein